MSSPARHPSAVHIGTGEFAFCAGARTPIEARPPRGYRDLGNVEVYKFDAGVETFEREGAYRGRRVVDASFVVSRGFNYLFRCDEVTRDNLKLLALGTDAGDNVRLSLVSWPADAMPFSAGQPTEQNVWYDISIAGEPAKSLTAVRLASAFEVDLVEGEHFVADLDLGRVRFLQKIAEPLNVVVDAPEITPDTPQYAVAIAPLQTTAVRGIGRFLQFRALDGALLLDHRGFSCLLSTAGLTEQQGKTPSSFDLGVRITEQRGQMWVRAQDDPFPDAVLLAPVDMRISMEEAA
jgi:hypothetical protein